MIQLRLALAYILCCLTFQFGAHGKTLPSLNIVVSSESNHYRIQFQNDVISFESAYLSNEVRRNSCNSFYFDQFATSFNVTRKTYFKDLKKRKRFLSRNLASEEYIFINHGRRQTRIIKGSEFGYLLNQMPYEFSKLMTITNDLCG